MSNLLKQIATYFSPANKKLREAIKIVPLINAKEEEFIKFTHQDILNKTQEFKNRYKQGEKLDDFLIEAFALVREGAKRVLYQRPYDVQMIGAYILHHRMVAEMYTGEGKTLVAVIAAYLNGITEKGVQVVTVNDYLAKRDSEETGKILKYMGLTVGLVQESTERPRKKEEYNKDVVYVSNHEIAFDYLRDNMEMYYENQVMIDRINFCIVDEADSVLIDEASTPLIISGPGPKSSSLYEKLTPIIKKLNPSEHLEFDEFKTKAELTESGMDFIEDELVKIGLLEPLKNRISITEEAIHLLVKDYLNILANYIFLNPLQKVPINHTPLLNTYFDELLGLDHGDKSRFTELLNQVYFKFIDWKVHEKVFDESDNDIYFFKNLYPIISELQPFQHFNYVYKIEGKEKNVTPKDLDKFLQGHEPMPTYLKIHITPNGFSFLRKKAIENNYLNMEGIKEFWKINDREYKTSRDTLHRINSNLYKPKNILINHYINQMVRANFIMKVDVDYIVSKSNEIVIIDQHTGRLGFGRRFSDGLHQAIEAKEGLEVKDENVTVASTTYQSFFQLFELAGMTGTAKESEEEFMDVYKLEIVSVPTNRPSQKKVFKDVLFFKNEDRIDRINEIVKEKYEKKQPTLIITLTVNDSEIISRSLQRNKIPHCLLNAKNHEEEANIIREAGKFGAITVATDIAGRGTDVQLGGSRSYIIGQAQERGDSKEQIDELVAQLQEEKNKISAIGGLCVLCIGRHESERLDNQASGRCGRQGEPGEVHFLLSIEDELLQNSMNNSGMQQWSLSEILESGENYLEGYLVDTWVNTIQKSKGAMNYESRKNLFRYDKIVDIQRKILYKMRNNLLRTPDVYHNFQSENFLINKSIFFQIIEKIIINLSEIILFNIDYTQMESIQKAKENFYKIFNINNEIVIDVDQTINHENILSKNFINNLINIYKKKLETLVGTGSAMVIGRQIKHKLIGYFDKTMEKYLQAISDSKDGSYLSSYAQKDPLNEFNDRMMGLLSDFFVEWQQSIVEFIFHGKDTTQVADIGEKIIMDNSSYNNHEELSLEQLEDFIKTRGDLFTYHHQLSPSDEEARQKLRQEIHGLFMDHMNNLGAIELTDDETGEPTTIHKSEENQEETMNALHALSDTMDLDQLKELKKDLLIKIHQLRNEISYDSEEYQDALLGEVRGIHDMESVVENLKNIIKHLPKKQWNKFQTKLIKAIDAMDIDDENWDWEENLDDVFGDVLYDIEDIARNVKPEDWEDVKDMLINQIEDLNPDDNKK